MAHHEIAHHETPRVLVGTSGWKKPQWRGHFYPPGLRQDRELEFISGRLGSLEVNTTFHALPRPSSYASWYDGTPKGFVFALKANGAATHAHRLRDPVNDVAEFFASGLLGLGYKLGPILWQLPATLRFDIDTVRSFLSALPHSFDEARKLIERAGLAAPGEATRDEPGGAILHGFEARHASFLAPEFFELLREHNVASVITSTSHAASTPEFTADFVYVRLFGKAGEQAEGNTGEQAEGYDAAALDDWARVINDWRNGRRAADGVARSVYVYFANHDERAIRAPFDALGLQRRLNAQPPDQPMTTVQPPLWN